jgi:hypothetical protein
MKKGVENMKVLYGLKNPRPNPYAERMKNGYTIIIDHDPVQLFRMKIQDEELRN